MSACPTPAARRRRLCRTAPPAPEVGTDGRRRSNTCSAVAALAALLLSACAESGDFGRPRPSVWSDDVLPTIGSAAAQARGEPVSRLPLTDAEDALRDRAWRFVMPAHERSWFDRSLAVLVRSRVVPVAHRPLDHEAYADALMGEAFRSPASRYNRLAGDILADAKLAAPFAATAERVLADDRTRLAAFAFVGDLPEERAEAAVMRVAENQCVIAWVRQESIDRLTAYRHALERLVIEAPQPEAIAAERALAALDVHRRALDGLDVPLLAKAACADGIAWTLDRPRGKARAVAPGRLVTK